MGQSGKARQSTQNKQKNPDTIGLRTLPLTTVFLSRLLEMPFDHTKIVKPVWGGSLAKKATCTARKNKDRGFFYAKKRRHSAEISWPK